MSVIDRVLCGLFQSHRSALQQYMRDSRGRIVRTYLACECGWESPGWSLMTTPAKRILKFRQWSATRLEARGQKTA